ncbi:hypothetical protein [Nocardia fusca]|uniref:Uncharacterized protein n=1 Tax=Nocardia fusca TaxID=941183 RepID=A0ABV3FA61_9NOCA
MRSMVWTLLMVMANESGSPVSGWRGWFVLPVAAARLMILESLGAR